MDSHRLLTELGEQSGDFALQCSDTAGFLARINRRVQSEAERLSILKANMDRLDENHRASKLAAQELQRTADTAQGILARGDLATNHSLDELSKLVAGVTGLEDRLHHFLGEIETIGSISQTLKKLAQQSQILGFNAALEATRGGDDAKGFGVVANEMRRLAGEAEQSSVKVSARLDQLETAARGLIEAVRSNMDDGRKASTHVDAIKTELTGMASLVYQFQNRSGSIVDCTARADTEIGSLAEGLEDFDGLARTSAARVDEARQRLDHLESQANDMLNKVAQSGAETRNSLFIDLAREGAAEAHGIIERGLAEGELSSSELFDGDYRAVPGTEPPQYTNGFVAFADRLIRPLLDRRTLENPAIVGCCLVDINGFLPTHVSARSRRQRPGEMQWNLENSRNRQIFMDSQTRRALDGADELYVYTYRQDFGDGRFRSLRSVLVPLAFGGRRWGLYELGYLI